MDPAALVPPARAAAARAVTERFQPGGVLQALVSGLIELALAAVFLAVSLEFADSNQPVANSFAAAAALWAVLAVYSLVLSLLRARVLAAELDDQAVVLHGIRGARRLTYDQLSAVEVSRNRTRLVARTGRGYTVRGVRGRAQGNRFRTRVLARATEAVQRRQGAKAVPEAGELVDLGPDGIAEQTEPTAPEAGEEPTEEPTEEPAEEAGQEAGEEPGPEAGEGESGAIGSGIGAEADDSPEEAPRHPRDEGGDPGRLPDAEG
jgi:hypothetical protein